MPKCYTGNPGFLKRLKATQGHFQLLKVKGSVLRTSGAEFSSEFSLHFRPGFCIHALKSLRFYVLIFNGLFASYWSHIWCAVYTSRREERISSDVHSTAFLHERSRRNTKLPPLPPLPSAAIQLMAITPKWRKIKLLVGVALFCNAATCYWRMFWFQIPDALVGLPNAGLAADSHQIESWGVMLCMYRPMVCLRALSAVRQRS